MIVRELLVKLGIVADTAKAEDFDKALGKVKETMGTLVDVTKKAVAAGASLGTALGVQAIATARHAEEVERQAAALGLSIEAYQELAGAVGAFGVEANDLADGFGQVAQVLGDAREGSEGAVGAFDKLGIKVRELKGLSVEQTLYRVADGLRATEDPTKRLQAANALLGEQLARQLLPLLIRGGAGLDYFRAQARATGAVLDKDAIAKGKAAAATFREFWLTLKGLRNEVGLAFLPAVEGLTRALSDLIRENKDRIVVAVENLTDKLAELIPRVEAGVKRADDFVRDHLGGWPNLFERAKVALGVLAAGAGWRLLAQAARAASVGMIELTGGAAGLLAGAGFATTLGWAVALAAALVLVYLAIDDVVTYMHGGKSVFGDFVAGSETAQRILAELGNAARTAGSFLSSLWLATKTYSAVVMEVLGPALPYLEKLGDLILTGLGNQALASLRAFTTGMRFAAEAVAFVAITVQELMRVLDGQLDFSAMLGSISDRTGSLIFEGRKALDQGIMAIPGIGAFTGGDMPAGYVPPSKPRVYVPNAAPYTGPGSGFGGPVTNQTVAGNTYNISGVGMDLRAVEEFSYRNDLVQGRQLAALSGAGF